MWTRILLIDNDEARLPRIQQEEWPTCRVRLHEVAFDHSNSIRKPTLIADSCYCVPQGEELRVPSISERTDSALSLLDGSGRLNNQEKRQLGFVANVSYAKDSRLLSEVRRRNLPFAVEISPSAKVQVIRQQNQDLDCGQNIQVEELLPRARWKRCTVEHGFSRKITHYYVTSLGRVQFNGIEGRLVVARFDSIEGEGARVTYALTSEFGTSLKSVVEAVSWTRWIKPFVRTARRRARVQVEVEALPLGDGRPRINAQTVGVRPNIVAARERDQLTTQIVARVPLRSTLAQYGPVLNVAELFAGAGGMGLGFLLASLPNLRYRIAFSSELHPIYARSLERNHQHFPLPRGEERDDWVPAQSPPLDLRQQTTIDLATRTAREVGGIQVLIGGPPCQGFSNANRNSGYSGNPNNRLVEVFLQYVEILRPRVFLMENVQGILWTPTENNLDSPMVVDHLAQQMERLGYLVFPKLLDAAWFGVPQHRQRFFLMGIHRDLGYTSDYFGEQGPFPEATHGPNLPSPYVTVADALDDLPAIDNGYHVLETPYVEQEQQINDFIRSMRSGAPQDIIWDHVTSRHSPYVLERYRSVPAGGNWQDIVHMMENYASHDGTHSNIYRRLRREEPSITIGHYRKAMLIHPRQDRGLSLREASRLQSFPDWFRFLGSQEDNVRTGISHKQQQLANAVCPLMLKAIANYILQI